MAHRALMVNNYLWEYFTVLRRKLLAECLIVFACSHKVIPLFFVSFPHFVQFPDKRSHA